MNQQPTTVHSTPASSTVDSKPANPPPISDNTSNLTSTTGTTTVQNAVWLGLRGSLQALKDTSGVFGPLASVAEMLLECFDTIETATKNEKDYEELAADLAALNEAVVQHWKAPTSPAMSNCISGVIIGIKHQALAIKEKQERGRGIQLSRAEEEGEDVIRHYRRIQSLFRQLQANLSMSTWSTVQVSSINERLKGLDAKKEAAYDSTLSTSVSRRTCTEGTRKDVMLQLNEWLHNSTAPSVYWMNGMAGTGKTTIACTFAGQLEQEKLLAASFFCTRTSADCRDATRIIPTIAYQLARYSIPFQSALYEILGEDPDAGSKNIPKQFQRLLVAPLQNAKDTIPGNPVVVIDALDECDDRNEVETLLDTLFRHASDVPLKFLVTSRPEPEIYKRMTAHSQSRTAFHLHDIESSLVQADIALYLEEELESMALDSTQINQLAEQSGSLFIYAATLVRYIKSGERLSDPHERLQWVLAMTPEATKRHAQIDALYTAVLQSALNPDEMDEHEMEYIRVVLRTVLFAQEPISVETIAVLAGIDNPQRVVSALRLLRSVLHQSEETGVVTTLHASFPDFMFSNERSGMYFCDVIAHSRLLAERCFLVMKDQLRFNICDLESSFLPDDKVENLQARVKEKISSTLAYSCRHWASHLALAPKSDELVEMMREFLSSRLLFWMEVLSLRRVIVVGIEELLRAKRWLQEGKSGSSELILLLEDARNFLTSYAGNGAVHSTPHIYISSLPFCPRSSLVYKHYWKRMRGLLELKGSLMDHREAAPLARWDIGASVACVVYSPDGSRFAAGCYDGTVSIRSAYDGTLLVGPMEGDAGSVRLVAFSPDGKFIASGFAQYSIQVWNAYSGTPVAGPFKGHTNTVHSISFSPDSSRMASGSCDGTIRVWDVTNGTLVLAPIEQGRCAQRVAFSVQGTLLASASPNGTVQLWNPRDGTLVIPFQAHASEVTSLAFTPNGAQLVSGSADATIHIWNVVDWSLATSPFDGRTDIRSAFVQPDGIRVASSDGNVVRVWSIEDGSLIPGPFVGHDGSASSITFSPDGTRATAPLGQEIQVWNLREGALPSTLSTLRDTIDGIHSVSFSSSNSFFLSKSNDDVISTWELSDGSFALSSPEAQFIPPPLNYLSPDGSRVACVSPDGEMQVVNFVNGSQAVEPLGIERSSISTFQFSHGSTSIILGCQNGTILVQSHPDWQVVFRSFLGHNGEITSIASSHDSSFVVSYSEVDKTLRVWNILAPPLDIEHNSDPAPVSTPDRKHTTIPGKWRLRKDGWVVNDDDHLLFWFPADIAFLWKSPYASLIITGSGTLQIPKQKPLVRDQWSKCYVGD